MNENPYRSPEPVVNDGKPPRDEELFMRGMRILKWCLPVMPWCIVLLLGWALSHDYWMWWWEQDYLWTLLALQVFAALGIGGCCPRGVVRRGDLYGIFVIYAWPASWVMFWGGVYMRWQTVWILVGYMLFWMACYVWLIFLMKLAKQVGARKYQLAALRMIRASRRILLYAAIPLSMECLLGEFFDRTLLNLLLLIGGFSAAVVEMLGFIAFNFYFVHVLRRWIVVEVLKKNEEFGMGSEE